MKLKNLIILLLLIPFVVASPYRIDENLEMGENDIYNATNINSTNVYQSGNRVLDEGSNLGNWSNDKPNYSTTAEIIAFGYYNASDFIITDYFTKSDILGFGYYNSSDFVISDYYTGSQILAFNYYNSSDFDINDYVLSTILLGYNYYNSSDFVISDYATNVKVDSLGNWSNDKSDYYTKSQADSTFITQANEGNLDVNSADYWDSLNTPSDISTGDLTDDNTYVQVAGDIITGNLTIDGYIDGQPIDGALGSGVIWSDDIDSEANINLTISGLDITYPNMIVRLVTTAGGTTDCNISSGTKTLSNNIHYVFYVDSDCTMKNTTFSNYLNTALSPGGQTDIFDAVASEGNVGIYKGATVANKETIKVRKAILNIVHLNILSGMNLNFDTTFPEVYQNTGEYVYIRTIVDTSVQNSTTDGINQIGHSGGEWVHRSQTGLNLTYCDNTTDLIECPTNVFRRYIIYTVGRSDGTDTTSLHMLAPLTTDTTYATMANCLNVVENPISYTLPNFAKYVAVPTYAYCEKRDDSAWRAGWIDLRQATGGAGALPDISNFLTKETTFSGDVSGTYDNIVVNSSAYWDDLNTPSDITTLGTFTANNITASHFIGNGSQLTGLTLTETDPVWSSNHTNMQVDCGAGLYSYGVYSNGTLKCRVDSGTSYTAGTGLSLIGSEFSFNETYGDNRYITSESDPIFSAWDYSDLLNKSSDTYVVTESDPVYSAWNKFTGIPHATPSNGDVTHFSYADEIYDWVIGLGYSTTTGTVTNIATGNGLTGGPITTTGTISTSALTAGANQYSYWDGDSWEVRNDDDTTYSAGNGISLSTTTFSVAGGTGLTQEASGLKVTDDGIGNTQLEYDTGQALTTTSNTGGK